MLTKLSGVQFLVFIFLLQIYKYIYIYIYIWYMVYGIYIYGRHFQVDGYGMSCLDRVV